jgi:hypothetical protein
VGLDNVSAEDLASTNTTVVWALRTWETVCGPSIGSVGHIKKGVLLLKTEPRLVARVGLHELRSLVAVVELVWGSIRIPAFTDDQDVRSVRAEWVREDSSGSEVDIRVVTGSLASRTAVEVPFWEIIESEFTALWDRSHGLQIVA